MPNGISSSYMFRFTLLALALLASPAVAQTSASTLKPDPPPLGFTSVEPVFPAGHVPGALGTADVDVPKLYTYPAPGPGPHPAIVVLPGGGYTHLVMEKEGGMEARWLNSIGVSAYVLQYRLWPRYRYPYPLTDGIAALRYVRSHAKEWNLRPEAIGIWGFSAGGHMAGYLATIDPNIPGLDISETASKAAPSARPDFAILSYARVDLSPSVPGTSGMATLVGTQPTQTELDAVNPILHITPNTSPTFLYATEHDEKVDSTNATHFFEALKAANVPVELHVFELGPHGTHMGTDQPKSPELAVYPLLLEHWLQLHGWAP